AANLARGAGPSRGETTRGFGGSRHGRGAGIGRLLTRRGNAHGRFRRRVIVKARIVRMFGKGAARALAHMRYLRRGGTTREGGAGGLYGRGLDGADGKAFHGRR